MSNDDESSLPIGGGRRFGSLADVQTVQQIQATSSVTAQRVEPMELDTIPNPQQKELMAEFDRRKKARTMTMPTDDVQVRLLLRKLDQPICMFGEDKPDRRERLRAVLSTLSEDEATAVLHQSDRTEAQSRKDTETWYHQGPMTLRRARIAIADYSLPRAAKRLADARLDLARPAHERALGLQEAHKWIRSVSICGSQVADSRPVSFCEFSPDSKHLVTSGWSGQCKLWSLPGCNLELAYTGHASAAGCARFHPEAYLSMEPAVLNVASCSHDGTVMLWNLESDQCLHQLEKHPARVSRIAFHPFDSSWRLFDLEELEEVLFQEGHSRPVFDIDFQCDGSLALTGGMDCYGRVWDLRTGRCIMFLEGHQKEIHTVTWSPNGYGNGHMYDGKFRFEMLTGSADNSCKVWDMRMRRCIYTVAAHNSLVSRLRVDRKGQFALTSSFDNSIKVWSVPGYQTLRQLDGHDTKVMCADISPDGQFIASASFDRTFKLWTKSDY